MLSAFLNMHLMQTSPSNFETKIESVFSPDRKWELTVLCSMNAIGIEQCG